MPAAQIVPSTNLAVLVHGWRAADQRERAQLASHPIEARLRLGIADAHAGIASAVEQADGEAERTQRTRLADLKRALGSHERILRDAERQLYLAQLKERLSAMTAS